jgi:hypothetical protein
MIPKLDFRIIQLGQQYLLLYNAAKHAPHEHPSQYLTRKIPSAKLLRELIEQILHKSVIAESVIYCMKGANCGKGYRDCGACWRDHHP